MEEGELPRVPVHFSLAPGKPAAPQNAALAASTAPPPIKSPGKGSPAPLPGNTCIMSWHATIHSSMWSLSSRFPSRAVQHDALNP